MWLILWHSGGKALSMDLALRRGPVHVLATTLLIQLHVNVSGEAEGDPMLEPCLMWQTWLKLKAPVIGTDCSPCCSTLNLASCYGLGKQHRMA